MVFVLRRLLYFFGKQGPLRGAYGSSRELVEQYDGSSKEEWVAFFPVLEPHRVQRQLPVDCPAALRENFRRIAGHTHPECFVVRISGGRVLSDRGSVLSPDHRLVLDVSNQMSVRGDIRKVRFHHAMRRMKLPVCDRLRGRVAVLGTAAGGNYFHWMTEALPRLKILERAGYDLSKDIDAYVINDGADFIDESLDMLGIDKAKRIRTDWLSHFEADDLVVPSLPGKTLNPPEWACAFLRDSFLPHRGNLRVGPRIFVTRSSADRRGIRNEKELADGLASHGFMKVDPGEYSLRDQISIFREAEVVVGAHGAALTNLIWCKEKTKVLELLPRDETTEWFWPYCYWVIGNACGLEYHCLQAERNTEIQRLDRYSEQTFPVNAICEWVRVCADPPSKRHS